MRKRLIVRAVEVRATQNGFTLLELLIGLVIVSILAAIAIPYLFEQRRKGWVAQVKASTRHMAGAQNYFVFNEGAPAFTSDLDDLYFVGYRWNERSVLPYVALATRETYCIQVHSAHDPTIVWHFSSNVGYPEEGPATPSACGDPDVLGTYIAGLPPASAARDGVPGTTTVAGTTTPGGSGSEDDGQSSIEEGEFDPVTGSGGGSGTEDGSTTTGSVPGYGTGDPTTGTRPGGSGDPGGTTGSTSGTCEGSSGGGGSSGTNHPSGRDRDEENGGSGAQGGSDSDPDGDENDGADKPGEDGGADTGDQDGNNGSGNDTDFEDDNRGPDRDGSSTPGSPC